MECIKIRGTRSRLQGDETHNVLKHNQRQVAQSGKRKREKGRRSDEGRTGKWKEES